MPRLAESGKRAPARRSVAPVHRPGELAWIGGALALACLGALPLARGAAVPVRLAVSMLETNGAAIELRLRIDAGIEPTIDLSSGSAPGSRRLVITWPGALALDRPLPDPASRGLLQALALRADEDGSRLELLLSQPVRAQLRRVADSWVLRIETETPAGAATPARGAPVAAPALPPRRAPALPAPPAVHDAAAAAVPAAVRAAVPAVPAVPAAVPAAVRAAAPPVPAAVPAGAPAVARGARAAPGRSAGAAPETLLVDVTVNGRPLADVVRAELSPERGLLLPSEAWTEARLAVPAQAAALSDGTPGYALAAIAGATYALDRQALRLAITVPPGAIASSIIAAQDATVAPPQRPRPGAVLNYDLSAASAGNGGVSAGALLEAIAFGPVGNLVSSMLLRDATVGPRAQRLDSFWRYDMPGRMQTLVLGDTVGAGGAWSRPVRYAGLRWGRDFGMRPGFVTLPQLALSGEAALPSTVDVLVNNARRLSQQVPPGPFELSNVPIVTGAGEINLVVRDLLGNQSVVHQAYYASQRLLAPGLTDFSVEAGKMRFGYGEDSRYRDGFAAATVRAGLARAVTGEARVEVQAGRRAAGIELAALLGSWAVGHAALARSQGGGDAGARGQLAQAGIERSTPHGGAAIEYEHASAQFAPFGELRGPVAAGLRPRTRLTASAGGALVGKVSGGASYVRQTRWNGEHVTLAGASLSMPVAQRASMNWTFTRRLDGLRDWRAAVNINLPLDDGISLGARLDRDSLGRPEATLAAARPAPAGPGLGWQLETSTRAGQRARARLEYNTNAGDLGAELAADAHGTPAARAGARGSLGILGGLPFASRPIGQGSFAVVEVEGMAGVPIKRSHQVVASTNARGLAFVPGLLPWQDNLLEIDPVDLPLDVTVGDVVQEVKPYAGSGMMVTFAVRRTRQALLVLRGPDGRPVPLGARVRVLPAGPDYTTGMRGETWLGDLPAGLVRVQVSWPAGGCTLALPAAAASGAPDRLGPLACAGAAR